MSAHPPLLSPTSPQAGNGEAILAPRALRPARLTLDASCSGTAPLPRQVGNGKVILPPELCTIVPGQRRSKLNELQVCSTFYLLTLLPAEPPAAAGEAWPRVAAAIDRSRDRLLAAHTARCALSWTDRQRR